MIYDRNNDTRLIKSMAGEFGFYACGCSPATKLDVEAERLRDWIDRRFEGQMTYLCESHHRRIDPRQLLPAARSVISLLYNYFPGSTPTPRAKFIISKYAYGVDYHGLLRKKLKKMVARMLRELGQFQYRICVDSTPIMEKAWAARSGLGWIGKNTNLINESIGSYFFLSEIIIDRDLVFDTPVPDLCADCRKCLDACPTQALVAPYQLDANRCISYLTIETKGKMPEEMHGTYRGWIFGCDICQDVCPFNQAAQPHNDEKLRHRFQLFSMTNDDWRRLTPENFETLFRGSAVKRAGYIGLMRNIKFVDL